MKRVVILLFLFCFLFPFVLSLSGVSPSMYTVDFVSNYKNEFVFNYVFDEGVETEIVVQGDLSQYVQIKKEKMFLGRKMVVVELSLPEKIDVPGAHKIMILAQNVKKTNSGVGIVSNVGGIIQVRVPYPGSHLVVSPTSFPIVISNPLICFGNF